MTRKAATELFGGVRNLADALECSTQAIYAWPETGPLPDRIRDRVLGAAWRTGRLPSPDASAPPAAPTEAV